MARSSSWISTSLLALGLLNLSLIVSCTKEKRELFTGSSASTPTGPATLSSMQSDVFLLGCAVSGCHDNRPNPAADIDMSTFAKTFEAFVNVPSQQNPDKMIVLPGDPDESYLIDKLRGTHLNGGSGDRMPQYSAQLAEGDIERVVQWVTDGAMLN